MGLDFSFSHIIWEMLPEGSSQTELQLLGINNLWMQQRLGQCNKLISECLGDEYSAFCISLTRRENDRESIFNIWMRTLYITGIKERYVLYSTCNLILQVDRHTQQCIWNRFDDKLNLFLSIRNVNLLSNSSSIFGSFHDKSFLNFIEAEVQSSDCYFEF